MERTKTQTKKIKKIVIVAHDHIGSYKVFEEVYNSFDECEFFMIIGEGLYYGKTFLQSVFHLIRKASLIFVFFRFIDLVKYKLRGRTLDTLCKKLNIPVIHTNDINSEDILSKVRSYNPDIILSIFTMQIFKKELIGIPKYGCINVHPGILPDYRGLETFFWAMANDENEIGVSAFFLNEEIDAGEVIREERFPLTDDYTMASLYDKCTEVSGRLLVKAIYDIDEDNINIIHKKGKGTFYHMPTREAVRRFLKLGKRFQ